MSRKPHAAAPADVLTTFTGSLITIEPLTDRGRTWLADNVDSVEATNGRPFHCEHTQGMEIIEGALYAGLKVKDSTTDRIAQRSNNDV
jgi:hypothetical protein